MNKDILKAKLEKLANFKSAGIDPYPEKTNRSFTNNDALKKFSSIKKSIFLVGRIRSIREMGNVSFAHIQDETGKIQIFLSKETIGKEKYKFFIKNIDIGDFIEVKGNLFKTKSGEKTLKAENWKILSKALKPLPSEWYGFKDEDNKHRHRYLDILFNKEIKEIIKKKAVFWSAVREFHLKRGFLEVETPVLENTTGGADAKPFITHHNALDVDLYLRISTGELWQKRLLIAGFPKVFEIGRIFRNEGISTEHLQDYTQLEYYMAYADYEKGMEMTKELYRLIGEKVFGTTKFKIREFSIDLGGEWQKYDFSKMIEEKFGINPVTEIYSKTGKKVTLANLKDICKKAGIEYEHAEFNIARTVDNLWKVIRKGIAGPGFLVNVPVYLEPLAKRNRNNSGTVERFQVILAGSEMGKGFSELNEQVDQKGRFMEQQALCDAGDDEAQMADMEFVEALEYAMPPAFGFGLSERLFSFLMDKPVRETQLFPLLKPEGQGKKNNKETMMAVAVLNKGAKMEPWQELNTVAHLNAAFGARVGRQKLFTRDTITSKDNHAIKLNIKNAIMVKTAPTGKVLRELLE